MDKCCSAEGPSKAGEARIPAVDDCCADKEAELSRLAEHADIRRVLLVVLAINFGMFLAELSAGLAARSSALIADSVDMLGDALVYALSLYALQRSARWRAGAALVKGLVIASFGVGVAFEVVTKLLHGVTPVAGMMTLFGVIALIANLVCLALLYRYRERDVNMASTFECSRNDVLANMGVLLAAAGVFAFESGWPDIIVGTIIAVLFGRSAVRVTRAAWRELEHASDKPLTVGRSQT